MPFSLSFLIPLVFSTGGSSEEDEDESSDEDDDEESSFFAFLFVIIFSFFIESLYDLFHHWSFQSKAY